MARMLHTPSEERNRGLENRPRQAAEAQTLPEALVYLHRPHRPDPYHPRLQRLTRQGLWRILQAEPYLAYQEETGYRYYVWNGLNLTLSVPKNRTVAAPYPPSEPPPLAPAWYALGWAMLGLALAGIGTLVFAPIALFRALNLLLQPPSRADGVRAAVIIVLSVVLWGLGAALGLLLLLHVLF